MSACLACFKSSIAKIANNGINLRNRLGLVSTLCIKTCLLTGVVNTQGHAPCKILLLRQGIFGASQIKYRS